MDTNIHGTLQDGHEHRCPNCSPDGIQRYGCYNPFDCITIFAWNVPPLIHRLSMHHQLGWPYDAKSF